MKNITMSAAGDMYCGGGKITLVDETSQKKRCISVNAIRAWKSSSYRLNFTGLEMAPLTQGGDHQKLNIFRGFKYDNIDCAMHSEHHTTGTRTKLHFDRDVFLNHIFKWLCNSDKIVYSYVIYWLAFILQKPMLKTKTALFFSSEEGVGKGILCSCLHKIIGPEHAAIISNPNDLCGKFNGYMRPKIFIAMDEVTSIEG